MSSKMTPGTSAPPAVIRRRMTGKQPEHAEERAKKVENPKAVEQNTKQLEEATSETMATSETTATKTKTEATKAAAKAKKTAESEAAAKRRRLNDLNRQLTSAQSKQATRLRELQAAEQAKKHAEEQVEEHVGDWAKQCNKKAMITKYQKAQDRLKTWIDQEEHLEKEIARLTTEAAVH
jgi:hypothetical protein